MKQRLYGIVVACMMCGEQQARWVVLNFFYCDDCVKKVD